MNAVTELTKSTASTETAPRKLLSIRQREARWGFFFISPWLIGFSIFYLFPMIASLAFSTLSFTLSTPENTAFVGLANWKRMLFEDSNVWLALGTTLKFSMLALPINMLVSFLLAVLLNSKHLFAKPFFRTLFYAPTMIPFIAAILIWQQVLNPHTGWINRFIEVFGIKAMGVTGLRWFDDPKLVYLGYTMIGLYGIGNTIVVNIAGLQSVPTELYEAAMIDGASWFRSLIRITLPMVSPVIFYNLILGIVGMMQYFLVPWVITAATGAPGSGYPEGTTNFFMIYFFKQAFGFANMGYGATLAWLIFIVALMITLITFASSRRWVYYAGEGK